MTNLWEQSFSQISCFLDTSEWCFFFLAFEWHAGSARSANHNHPRSNLSKTAGPDLFDWQNALRFNITSVALEWSWLSRSSWQNFPKSAYSSTVQHCFLFKLTNGSAVGKGFEDKVFHQCIPKFLFLTSATMHLWKWKCSLPVSS